ncbi:MAG: hypothetical protein OXK21_06195 [Chloroflexota bacterium]|nr:hypothetical protein [Chloroflexota bacterium]
MIRPEDILKYAPRFLLSLGGALFGLAVLIAVIAEGRPGIIYVMGGVGLLMMGFGLTVYFFTEGVAGRRTGA